MSHQDSEDEIFVREHPDAECARETDEAPTTPTTATEEQPDLRAVPHVEPNHAAAPYGYTRSGKPRKSPLKSSTMTEEQLEETRRKRREALEKGRAARAEKILARKRAVVDFFGEDCLRTNTLKNLEAAMADAKASLKATSKKVWAKPSRTTLPTERVVGRRAQKAPEKTPDLHANPEKAPEPAEKPAEKAPEKAPDLRANPEKAPEKPPEPKSAFRPVSATPPPIVWRPKAKKRLY